MQIGEFKSPLGIIRAEVEIQEGKISKIEFTGDFFVYPESRLQEIEERLKGSRTDREILIERIQSFYDSVDVKTPLLKPAHWVKAIERALEEDER